MFTLLDVNLRMKVSGILYIYISLSFLAKKMSKKEPKKTTEQA